VKQWLLMALAGLGLLFGRAPAKASVRAPQASDESLAGFRRAKRAALPRDIVKQAADYLQFPMGSVHLVQAQDGRVFAMVLENHWDEVKQDHKGVSVFIRVN